jgi:hypothetical protein
MKYVSFPWLLMVAAHDRKMLVPAQHSSGSDWLWKKKTILALRIQLRQSNPTIPFKLCRRLNALQYIHHRLFSSWPAVLGVVSSLFIWQRRCCNYPMASTTYRKH